MKYTFLIVLGLGLTFSSCQKFLEEVPTSSLTSESVITSTSGALAVASGPYRSLAGHNQDHWSMGTQQIIMEYWTGKSGGDEYSVMRAPDFQRDQMTGHDLYFTRFWDYMYQGVRDCNLSLEMIPKTTITEPDKAKYIAELRTLRAWYYFNIVRYWGDVPENMATLTDVNQAQKPRTSLKMIYDRDIIPDLEAAIAEPNLADAKSADGRVTKYIARMIAADVYLTCAGYPYQEVATSTDTTKRWCEDGLFTATAYPVNSASAIAFLLKAKTQLDILYGKYALGTYDDLHDPAMNNKGESIFAVQYLVGTVTSDWLYHALPFNAQNTTRSTIMGAFHPLLSYEKSYDPADKRMMERQMFFTSDTKTPQFDPNEGPDLTFNTGYAFLFKFYDKAAFKTVGSSSLNFMLYRYAETLLMLSEVNWTLRQLGQSVTDADIVKGINEVRRRALLPEFVATDLKLIDIMSERAYELVFETKMIWDQRRTRLCLVDGSGKFSRLESFFGHRPELFEFTWGKKHLLAPISGTEMLNNAKCSQNYQWAPQQLQ